MHYTNHSAQTNNQLHVIKSEERETTRTRAAYLPGVHGPSHASLLSNSNLKLELSSHLTGSLYISSNEKHKWKFSINCKWIIYTNCIPICGSQQLSSPPLKASVAPVFIYLYITVCIFDNQFLAVLFAPVCELDCLGNLFYLTFLIILKIPSNNTCTFFNDGNNIYNYNDFVQISCAINMY